MYISDKNFQIKMYNDPQKNVLILTKSADPDEMLHSVSFHLGLHCLAGIVIHFSCTKETVNIWIILFGICRFDY